MLFLADYHIHPDFSIDAEGSIHEYCECAVKLGLAEICFTSHYESDPERREIDGYVRVKDELVPVVGDWLDLYFEEIYKAQKYFKGRLKIKAGLEMDYIPENYSDLKSVVNNYPFDYVLGAVHSLDHIAISSSGESEIYFSQKTASQVLDEYYELIREAVNSGIYDGIAHLDIYKRNGVDFFSPSELEKITPQVEKAIKDITRSGIAVEVNSSGLRQGVGDTFPGEHLLRYCVNSGVKIFTVGSDAHRLGALGKDVDKAVERLNRMGISKIAVYSRRKPYEAEVPD